MHSDDTSENMAKKTKENCDLICQNQLKEIQKTKNNKVCIIEQKSSEIKRLVKRRTLSEKQLNE